MSPAHKQYVRINDLRTPVLSNAARHALKEAQRNPVEFSSDAVMSAVSQIRDTPAAITKEITSSVDCLIESSAHVADMTALGRTVIYDKIVRSASLISRLRELLYRYPEINEIELESPIIITGLARSGSNYLYGLLAADSRFRALSREEATNPIPVDAIPTRRPIEDDFISVLNDLLPYFHLMYPSGPDDLRETHDIHLGLHPESLTDSLNTLKTMLKVLQWRRSPRRWLIKSPIYSTYLDSLIKIFPNATIVMTHRDPIPSLVSDATMHAYVQRIFHNEVDVRGVFERDADILHAKLASIIRNRQFVTSDKLVDVYFQKLVTDEIVTIRRIYDTVGIELDDEECERLSRFKEMSAKRRFARIKYDLENDFERSYTELNKRYKFYTDRFPVDIETSY